MKILLANMKLSEDGYQVDVIGEYTPDLIVSEFLKGERQLIDKILQAEIDMFRSIRDGTALMQHMEDFYYITLLEENEIEYVEGYDDLEEEDELDIEDFGKFDVPYAAAGGDEIPSVKKRAKSSDDSHGHDVGVSSAKRKKKLVELIDL